MDTPLNYQELLRQKRGEILRIAARCGAYNVHVLGSVARAEAREERRKPRGLRDRGLPVPSCPRLEPAVSSKSKRVVTRPSRLAGGAARNRALKR